MVVVEQAQTGNPLNIVTNIATITGSATVRPDLIGALPAITPTPVVDPTTGAVTSYTWFAGGANTVCDPRITAPANQQCTSASVFALPYNAAGVAHFGNLARNAIYGPGFGDMDLSIIKNVEAAGQRAHPAAARGRSTCSTRRTSVSRDAPRRRSAPRSA